MACANILLTIMAFVIIALTLWPTIAGVETSQWIVVLASIVVIILAWAGVKCRFCRKPDTKTKAGTKAK